MIKFLAILSLILSLIAPHGATAHGDAHAHGHADVHHDRIAEDDGHDDNGMRHCCDAIVGGCIVAAVDERLAVWSYATPARAKSFAFCGSLSDDITLTFDPPPPRV